MNAPCATHQPVSIFDSPAALPATRPDGSAWPHITFLIEGDDAAAAVTIGSIEAQVYPVSRIVRYDDVASSDITGELLWVLRGGDILQPDAAAAAALQMGLCAADVLAGGSLMLTAAGERMHLTAWEDGPWPQGDQAQAGPWLGECVFRANLWNQCKNVQPADDPRAALFHYCAQQQARLFVIARALVRSGTAVERSLVNSTAKLVFFNDLGSNGGAGIAHHRIATGAAMGGAIVKQIGVAPAPVWTPPPLEQVQNAIAQHSPDIVLIGNVHCAAMGGEHIEALCRQFPSVQITHDLWALTGRCAYPGACDKYLRGCDAACPTANEYPSAQPSAIAGLWKTKRQTHTSAHAPLLAGVSRFSERFIRDTLGHAAGAKPVISFRYGLPLDTYAPLDRRTCRRLLDLPLDQFIILFSSADLADKRKGLGDLLAAMEILKLENVLLVSMGRLHPALAGDPRYMAVGYLDDPKRVAMLYAAADLFVGPSKAETFGQVFAEAPACGTPAIGYDIPGVDEAIADGVSGLLARPVGVAALAESIRRLHDDAPLRKNLSLWGRLWLENNWSIASAARRFYLQMQATPWRALFDLSQGLWLDLAAAVPVSYLSEAGDVEDGELQQLRRQRDQWKHQYEQVVQTRLWRLVQRIYPPLARIWNHRRVPQWLRKMVQGPRA